MSKIIKFIGELPTTKIRILFTVAIWVGTAIWVFTGGMPSIEFLGTIVAMSGLDAVQHIGKRATANPEVIRATNGTSTYPTDSDERG